MILYGRTSIVVPRYGIEDTGKVIRNEIIFKVMFAFVSMAFIALFVALKAPAIKEEIWNTLKDFTIYSIALILNIILGFRSSDIAHASRIIKTEDRLTIIRNHVGEDVVKEKEDDVVNETRKATTETLEAQLDKLKKMEGNSK
jgi:hypothetical protein